MNTISDSLFGDQLLVSVLAQFDGFRFKISNEIEIVNAFYEADQSGQFESLFVNYSFDSDGPVIKSSVLEEAIDSLQQTRLLGRTNPDLKEYQIQKSVKLRYEKFLKNKLTPDKEQQIIELSQFINNKLNFEKVE